MYRGLVLLWPRGEKYGRHVLAYQHGDVDVPSAWVWQGAVPSESRLRGGRSLEVFGQENLEDRVFLLIGVGGEGGRVWALSFEY